MDELTEKPCSLEDYKNDESPKVLQIDAYNLAKVIVGMARNQPNAIELGKEIEKAYATMELVLICPLCSKHICHSHLCQAAGYPCNENMIRPGRA